MVKILWVDDEIELLKPHVLFLRGKGYEVDTCNNGYDAIDMATEGSYDLIILDPPAFAKHKNVLRNALQGYRKLNAIAFGYTKLLEESSGLLEELKTVVNANGLSMSDKERMDVIDRVYRDVKDYRNLVAYYTNRNISVSYLRAKEKNDTKRILSLYGSANERYW